MRILHIIPQLGPGGAERLCVDLCNTMAVENEVALCVLHDVDTADNGFFVSQLSSKVKLISLKKRYGPDLYVLGKVLRLIQSFKPDCINSHLNSILYVNPATMLTLSPHVHTMHNVADKEQESSLLRKIYSFCFRFGKVTPIAISNTVKNTISEEYGVVNIPVIENGVKAPEVSSKFSEVQQEVESLKNSACTKVLLCVARFSEQKNLQLLVEAFNLIIADGEDAILLVIGDGPSEEVEKVRQLCGKSIHLLGKRKNIGDYLRMSDALCLSSKWEGLPITVLEAIAVEVVVLSTTVGGIPDVLEDGRSGLLVSGFSVASYADLIKRFLSLSESELEFMKGEAKKQFFSRFDMKITKGKYIDLYRDVGVVGK